MKHLITKLVAILSLIALWTATAAAQSTNPYDHPVFYTSTPSGGTTTILGLKPEHANDAIVQIPAMVGDAKVIGIAARAFKGNTTLEWFICKFRLQFIGDEAFSGCTSLEGWEGPSLPLDNYDIPLVDMADYIGDKAFYGCSSLRFGYVMNAKTIGNSAFEGSGIVHLTIGPDTEHVGYRAFARCPLLVDAIVGPRVTTIDAEAFSGCPSLCGVFFKMNVHDFWSIQSIGAKAFINCPNLTSLDFPDTLQSIGEYAFDGTSLHHLEMGGAQTLSVARQSFSSIPLRRLVLHGNISGNCSFADCATLTQARFDTDATTVNPGMFTNCVRLKELHLTSVKNIGAEAFKGCSAIETLDLAMMVSVGSNAFEDCVGLKRLNIAGFNDGTVWEEAFKGCSSLASATLGEGIKDLRRGVFEGCSSLTTINLPETLTHIGQRALADCSSLATLTLPLSVYNIDNYALAGCTSLKSLTIGGYPTGMSLSNDLLADCPLRKIEIRGDFLWPICKGLNTLREVLYSGSATYVPQNMFMNCTALESVNLGHIEKIGVSSFQGCASLSKVIIPDETTFIDSRAFSGCSALAELKIGENTASIWNGAFADCVSLSELNIPDAVTDIRDAFSGCVGIKSLRVGNGITHLNGFEDLKALESLRLGKNIANSTTSPKQWTKLSLIEIYNPTPPSWLYEFPDDVYRTATLKVPSGSVEAYRNARIWKNFFHLDSGAVDSVEDLAADNASEIIGYYNLRGDRSDRPVGGYNIVVYPDGSTKKLLAR